MFLSMQPTREKKKKKHEAEHSASVQIDSNCWAKLIAQDYIIEPESHKLRITFTQVINGSFYYNPSNHTYWYSVEPLKIFCSFPSWRCTTSEIDVGKTQKFLYLYTEPSLYDPSFAIPLSDTLK